MTEWVIDASVAIKWVVPEVGAIEALELLERGNLAAPELWVAECSNILWKKVMRSELSKEEANLAARLLETAAVEILPTRSLLTSVTEVSVELQHAAYDCLYLALAENLDCPFVTADASLVRKLKQASTRRFADRALSVTDALQRLDKPG